MDVEQIEQRMARSVNALKEVFVKIRTGRAHSGLLDHVKVACYGQEMLLPQAAKVAVGGSRLLTVTPWDSNNLATLEKAIRDSDLGLNPANDGTRILVNLPELSGERRAELVKVVKREAENARVAIRNTRRDAIAERKAQCKNKEISENELHREEKKLQQLTDKFVTQIDDLAKAKASELMKL